jgi:hypothetical protein
MGLGTPVSVIFGRAAREPVYITGVAGAIKTRLDAPDLGLDTCFKMSFSSILIN